MKKLLFRGRLIRNRVAVCAPRYCRCLSIVLISWLAATPGARGGGAVADCTEQALRDALQGGGTVTFASDCSITVSQTIDITNATTTIDAAGHNVSINGGGSTRIFQVGGILALQGVTLISGRSQSGGALFIKTNGVVMATDCRFIGNIAAGSNGMAGVNGRDSSTGTGGTGSNGTAGNPARGGAIYNLGTVTLTSCKLWTNSALGGNGGNGGNGGIASGTLGTGGDGGNGGIGGAAYGGAIYNGGSLTHIDCAFTGNYAGGGNGGAGGASGSGTFAGATGQGAAGSDGYGGAIYNALILSAGKSAFSANNARGGNSAAGGSNSDLDGRDGPGGAHAGGGALFNAGQGTVTNSTFYSNSVRGGNGGNGGNGKRTLSTGGDGGNGGNAVGGAVQSANTLNLAFCTLSSSGAYGGTNGAGGSGSFPGNNGSAGTTFGGNIACSHGVTTLKGTLIGLAASGAAGWGIFTDAAYNMTPDTSITLNPNAPSYPNTTNLLLGTFGDNGGPTPTVPLLSGSPAIDRVPSVQSPATDQRGLPRPLGTNSMSDIGAFESELLSAPIILRNLADTNVAAGSPVTLAVSASGAAPLRYQWRLQETAIPGATSSAYVIANPSAANSGPYMVVVTNNYGSVLSSSATIHFKPAITSQPTDQVVPVGRDAAFSVAATGDQPLAFQWSFYGTNLAGATRSALVLTNAQLSASGVYRATVTNLYGSVVSSTAALNFLPTILTPPGTQTVARGQSGVFEVGATGTQPLSYQWRFNGVDMAGQTRSSLTVPNVQTNNLGLYTVAVRNVYGSTNASGTLRMQLRILADPASLAVNVGDTATFSVSAEGTPPLTYQWLRNGLQLPRATGSAYVLTNVQPPNAGAYSVVVRDAVTNATSASATLTVRVPQGIYGRVTDTASRGVGGVTVSAGGTNSSTDPSGNYTILGLQSNYYTVTASANCYSFTPASLQVLVSGPDDAVANFTATRDSYQVSGLVSGLTGSSTSISLALVGSTNAVATTTNGQFLFSGLCAGNYTLTPQGSCYTYSPPSRLVTLPSPNANAQNFSATPNVYSVRGRITLGGSDLGGVRVVAGPASTVTDASGGFILTNLCPGNYLVIPTSGCIVFNPPQRPVSVGPDVQDVNFTGYTNDIYSVSGRVTFNGAGLTNVTISAGDRSVQTDASGSYTLPHLCPGPSTIVASLPGFGFQPASISVNLSSDLAGQNFTAFNVYTISGHILESGSGLGQVTVRAGTNSAATASDGSYQLTNMVAGNYTIVPTQACKLFMPASRPVTVGPNSVSNNFSAIPNGVYAIRGLVTEGPYPLAGVTLWLGGQQQTSDANGSFSFLNLCPGTYTLVPSLTNYSFQPAGMTNLLISTTDRTGVNFMAGPTFSISRLGQTEVELVGGGTPGTNYIIETSPDLLHWHGIFTNPAPVYFTEQITNSVPDRYYRLRR